MQKITERTLAEGSPVHSFRTLLDELATLGRNTRRTPGAVHGSPTFDLLTVLTSLQRRAFDLIGQMTA